MNALQQAHRAYSSGTAPIKTNRQVEYEMFAQITHALKAAEANKDRDYPAFVQALHKNRELWTILAADVADPANHLPRALKAQIFYLAEFTTKHSKDVLSNNEGVEVLTDLNLSIMRGLSGAGATV